MRIAVAANSGWYLYNFRRALMNALRDAGHQPVAISPRDEYAERLVADGFPFLEFPLDASSVNPLRELATVARLRALLARSHVAAAFTYTPKVNIYMGLACKGLDIHHVPNVSGLGRVFIARSWLTPVVTRLYSLAFRSARIVVFQNEDDRREFLDLDLVERERTVRVPGSGVDLSRFTAQPPARDTAGQPATFLFIGRILRDKGVLEFVEAARRMRQRHGSRVEFRILGSVGSQNPAAVPIQQVGQWSEDGWVTYLGSTDDVRPAIAQADCVVLPSYREGVPRVLLEAGAMARPCITTNAPGCRDAVEPGVTGLMCEVRDVDSLVQALERFLELPAEQRAEMGRQGRLKMEREFDERVVLDTYVGLARDISQERARS